MALPPFPFDTLGARKILTDAGLSDPQADAILKTTFMVVAASMAQKSQGLTVAVKEALRSLGLLLGLCGLGVALLKLLS